MINRRLEKQWWGGKKERLQKVRKIDFIIYALSSLLQIENISGGGTGREIRARPFPVKSSLSHAPNAEKDLHPHTTGSVFDSNQYVTSTTVFSHTS